MAPPASSGCPGFDCVGFVPASDGAGLRFPPATPDMLLQDGPPEHRYLAVGESVTKFPASPLDLVLKDTYDHIRFCY